MWASLSLRGRSEDGIKEEIWDLRTTSLRVILAFTITGHLLWHMLFSALSPFDDAVKAWLIFPVVIGGEFLSYYLLSRSRGASAVFFVTWALAGSTAAIWLFQAQETLYLYPLVATIVLDPLAGFLVVAGEALLIAVLSAFLPADLGNPSLLLMTIVAAAFSVLASWTLIHRLTVATNWSVDSYEQARRNMRDAQDHRAKLVQALRQLDIAYDRLQGANSALAWAWRAADNAERAKAELVANISHELRTPLNLIVGFSEMMISAPETYDSQPLPREYRSDLLAIYRSAQHLLALTDDVLDLAQAEVNRLALVREPTRVGEVIQEAVDIVCEYIQAKGLTVDLTVERSLPLLNLDRLRIRQVVLNLLSNAARFTVRGSISLDVARQGHEVLITVCDSGQGISPEKLDKIFEEFQHVNETAAREHLSTGLGLPISKKFIELHQGRVWAESELGMGSRFYIALPIESGDAPERSDFRGGGFIPPVTSQRVLVLADEIPALRRLLRRGLESYRIIATPGPEEAVRRAKELRASAIIADRSTTLIDATTPVIRFSFPREHGASLALGVDGYLVKPIKQMDLRAAIDRLKVPINKILIADDDHRAVRLLARMVRVGGHEYELLRAHNGEEALTIIRADRPDLVILDLAMPIRSGQDVVRALREDPETATIPVIVVSALGPEEEALVISSEVQISKAEGMTSHELVNVVDSVVTALSLPRQYLPAND